MTVVVKESERDVLVARASVAVVSMGLEVFTPVAVEATPYRRALAARSTVIFAVVAVGLTRYQIERSFWMPPNETFIALVRLSEVFHVTELTS